MDEQKRLLLAVVLSIIVLVGYQFFFVTPPEVNNLPQDVQEQPKQEQPQSISSNSSNVSDYNTTQALPAQAQPSAGAAARDFRTISLSTPLYEIVLSEHLASVKSLELRNYKESIQKGSPLKQLIPEQLVKGIMTFDVEGGTIQGLGNAVYSADTETNSLDLNQGERKLTFSWTNDQGISVRKIFTFRADSYLIDCDILIQNGSNMPLNDALVFSTPGYLTEEIKKRARFAFEGPLAYIDNKFVTIDTDDLDEKNTYPGKIAWSGFSHRYFLTCVMPAQPVEGRIRLSYANDIVSNDFIQKLDRLDPGKQGKYTYELYMGPKSYKVLSQYDNMLKKAINFGWFDIIAKPLLITMNAIHDVIPNYGVAIILLTILIKLIFWPLGTKSYKSMNEMKKVQPLMMEIREKYKGDKQRMNQEIMGLYKTYKVNPASGCLPLLVQMPIFFALYRMLYQAIELRHAPFVGWINDLSGPDRLFHFDFSIPMMQEPSGIPVLTLLMGASFLLQQKMTPTAGDPMQAKMMMLMPIMMTVLFINFPAGLVLYMFVNNIISMGQQFYTQKKFSK
ncbi:membrane protein insertase YidC [Desulfospira joergensenii]|uniref:membrane protein insertase YidC n=1 Tax=Desulfospira joergensenii TaxID=53329 RepID=UPI0003B2EB4A|nr:membrane protein insertase YidC [Desulfospira joergensenii]